MQYRLALVSYEDDCDDGGPGIIEHNEFITPYYYDQDGAIRAADYVHRATGKPVRVFLCSEVHCTHNRNQLTAIGKEKYNTIADKWYARFDENHKARLHRHIGVPYA